MQQLAEDVYQLKGWPKNAINVYVIGDVLIDAATRQAEKRIMRQIAGRTIAAHALTHAHPDHQGASHAVCEQLGIPLWCGQGDVPAMETPGAIRNPKAPGWLNALQERFWTGPPHPVARALSEGDEVAGFTVLETPGHAPGHVSYWRESDRVLIVGDVLGNMNFITGIPGLNTPPDMFTPDPARNRESARRLAELRPALACFGHGAPLRDPGKLAEFVAKLPS
ncbi:MAG TPA: MBL fold metallo-hydrolase [Solirubrobacteraceae bacterium]|jgi:glyoxylase-like metal-dependent hydrolase (beta-lactamase superfamily II)|nr:MBL fold metallo-hydrolase [Solirubrobacteraceae bacterium]